MTLKDYMRNTVWFPETTNDTESWLQWLVDEMEPLIYEAGDVILYEGDDTTPKDMYFIREGHVVVKGSEIEEGHTVRLGAGEIFGETALLFDTKRTATVTVGKECKKCNGTAEVGGKRKYPCTRCGGSGARVEGPLIVVYRLTAAKYAEFLRLPDLAGNEGAAGVYMMQYVLRRCVKTAYPLVPWTHIGLARLAEAFEFKEYGAGEVPAEQADVWDNFCIVVKGHVKCFQNEVYLKDCFDSTPYYRIWTHNLDSTP